MLAVLSVIAAILTLIVLGRRLPLANVVAIGLLILGASATIELLAEKIRFPFIPLRHLPIWLRSLLWLILLLNGREALRIFWKQRMKHNFGLYLFISTIVLTTLIWAALDIILGSSIEVVVQNLPGKLATAFLILLLAAPWFLVKKLSMQDS